jgi:hypothetical protein
MLEMYLPVGRWVSGNVPELPDVWQAKLLDRIIGSGG